MTNQMSVMGQAKRWLSVSPMAQQPDVTTICRWAGHGSGRAEGGRQ